MHSPVRHGNESEWKVIYNGQDHQHLSNDRQTLARPLSIPKSMSILSDKKTDLSTVTELVSPRLKLPKLGNDTVERVFPVRSVVSFDSTPSSALQTPSLDKLESPITPFADSVRANGTPDERTGMYSRKSMRDTESLPRRPNYLTRMRQQPSLSNISPSILRPKTHGPDSRSFNDRSPHPSSGRSNEDSSLSAQLQNTIRESADVLARDELTQGLGYFYEDETNLVVQPFGALLVVSFLNGPIIVQAASSNSGEILGYSPDDLFSLYSIMHILPILEYKKFFSHIGRVSDDDYDVQLCGPEVFSLSISTRQGGTTNFWCTMHTSRVYRGYIICELERGTPDINEKQEASGFADTAPVTDYRARFDESELLNTLPRIVQKISSTQTLESLVHQTMSSLQQLTLFERITMYHFDSDQNGIVVADWTDASLDLESCEGLKFPESSFPDEMKKQYLRNAVSFAYRKDQDFAELRYRASTIKMGLDLSHCYLLASPGSSEVKSDLPIQACISIGIYAFGKLWGLVSCQSYDENTRLRPLVQRACWLLSETISSNIERLSYTLPFHAQPNPSSRGSDVKPELQTPSGDLLGLFGADYAAASILGETKILGKPPDSQEALALLEYLRAKELSTVLWSTDILSDFGDLDYSPGFRNISGLIYIPLSADGQDFIVFFRREIGTEQKARNVECNRAAPWGQPSDGENLKTRQTEWSAAELGKASILSLLYRTFTEIWQEKEATMQNNQLMRLLLANSAHEFRTPLNAIINYLEIALDGNINQETRDNLSRSHSASKSLIYIINDLLDLTNAENGQRLIKDEVFNLSDTLCEATNIFWEEARQKHVDLQVVQHAVLPAVLGDQRRVRQVITNLISNAVQHTSTGAVTIESCVLPESWEPDRISVEVAIHDTGSGMSQEAVETLFCELEQVSNKEYMQNPPSYSDKSDLSALETESVLGLGLALVARIVRNMDGQLSLKSEEGKGSCFKIRLKFPLPPEEVTSSFPQACTRGGLQSDAGAEEYDSQKPNEQIRHSQQASGGQYESNREIQEKDGVSCCCGEPIMSESAIGRIDSPLVDADVTLLNGESRNLTILASGTKVEDKVPLRSNKTEPFVKSKPISPDGVETPEIPINQQLRVLIAEDDPINSSIVQKRLEKFGYSVRMTGNGKECASVYNESPNCFDVILMDIQMPIVDGLNATKMIRQQEWLHSTDHDRTPVFAVSASLVEKDRQIYMDAGFDGWIMKPVDFQRVHQLLDGVLSVESRIKDVYEPGMWEQGGWFE
ncbi:CheY-like superfamily [Penicillium malachiteum]|uniref:CheY-like superfamily n=1 Tax=Penicillium malachiteum TaxID=1324776 RepID=UPI0025489449|nr:CheY-like superfamily [Penicillium malachiteum]KAJ5720437.1 CheY-like superfamily [Penicillium malachiteum]